MLLLRLYLTPLTSILIFTLDTGTALIVHNVVGLKRILTGYVLSFEINKLIIHSMRTLSLSLFVLI